MSASSESKHRLFLTWKQQAAGPRRKPSCSTRPALTPPSLSLFLCFGSSIKRRKVQLTIDAFSISLLFILFWWRQRQLIDKNFWVRCFREFFRRGLTAERKQQRPPPAGFGSMSQQNKIVEMRILLVLPRKRKQEVPGALLLLSRKWQVFPSFKLSLEKEILFVFFNRRPQNDISKPSTLESRHVDTLKDLKPVMLDLSMKCLSRDPGVKISLTLIRKWTLTWRYKLSLIFRCCYAAHLKTWRLFYQLILFSRLRFRCAI